MYAYLDSVHYITLWPPLTISMAQSFDEPVSERLCAKKAEEEENI